MSACFQKCFCYSILEIHSHVSPSGGNISLTNDTVVKACSRLLNKWKHSLQITLTGMLKMHSRVLQPGGRFLSSWDFTGHAGNDFWHLSATWQHNFTKRFHWRVLQCFQFVNQLALFFQPVIFGKVLQCTFTAVHRVAAFSHQIVLLVLVGIPVTRGCPSRFPDSDGGLGHTHTL